MQPSMQKMDIENVSFPKEYFASHIVQKQGRELVSKDAAEPLNSPWRTAILGRAVQRYWQDDTSPDALNGIFLEKFEALLGTFYRTDQVEDLNQLKGRLTHLIDNAKAFEEFKREIFSKAWVAPIGLASLEPFIQQAESRKQQVDASLAALQEPKDSPRKVQMEKLNRVLGLAMTHLLKADPKTLEGVFRIEGESGKVKAMTHNFIELESEALAAELNKENSSHTIAKAMTRTLRELNPPLITPEFYPFFLAAKDAPTEEKKIEILKNALKMLPPENQALLKMLFTNLRQLSEQKDITKMDAKNLAIVWGPNLLQSPIEHMRVDAEQINDLTRLMIQHDIFS